MWRLFFKLAGRLGLFKRKRRRKAQPWKPAKLDRPDKVVFL